MIRKVYNALYWRIERKVNNYLLIRKIKSGKVKDLKLHFGCGSNPLKGYINIDYQFSKGIDIQEDLNEPKIFLNNSIIEIFSNAFLEHLYRKNIIIHFKKCFDILNDDGVICYLGIPYFPEIARIYLKGSSSFKLYNVYRYTHGDPETDGENGDVRWLAQLHKSLFDYFEIKYLLENAGFKSFIVFKYSYPNEEQLLVNCGFFAKKSKNNESVENECIHYLYKFDKEKIIVNSIEFLNENSFSI